MRNQTLDSEPKNKDSFARKGLRGLTTGFTLAGGALTTASTLSLSTVWAANYLVSKLTKVPPPDSSDLYSFSPFETAVDFEEVSFPLPNGRLLSGWFLPRTQTDKVVVTSVGYGGKRQDMLGISSYLWRNGFNVLLFDYRGCGANRQAGDIRTLGHGELVDFQAALAYVKERFGEQDKTPHIGALGGSLGAAVVLVAAAQDSDIKAVWADSSFTNRKAVVTHNWQKATHLPTKPFMDVADRVFEQRTGQRLADFSALDAVKQIAPRPIYFIHGGSDQTTPPDHAHQLYAAATDSPRELWIDPQAYHCGVYFFHRLEYCRRAVEFFDKYLVV